MITQLIDGKAVTEKINHQTSSNRMRRSSRKWQTYIAHALAQERKSEPRAQNDTPTFRSKSMK